MADGGTRLFSVFGDVVSRAVVEVGGETELRDIKTRYSDRRPLPDEDEKLKIACYALISRQALDIDRFILDYPLQGSDVKIDTRARFTHIARIA